MLKRSEIGPFLGFWAWWQSINQSNNNRLILVQSELISISRQFDLYQTSATRRYSTQYSYVLVGQLTNFPQELGLWPDSSRDRTKAATSIGNIIVQFPSSWRRIEKTKLMCLFNYISNYIVISKYCPTYQAWRNGENLRHFHRSIVVKHPAGGAWLQTKIYAPSIDLRCLFIRTSYIVVIHIIALFKYNT